MGRSVRPPQPEELNRVANSILCGGMRVDAVLGGKLTLRYLQKRGDGYVFLPCEWDAINKQVQPFRPGDWQTFSFDEKCAACHTTGWDAKTTRWLEPGVGCESCHGPASRHGAYQNAGGMVKFAELSPVNEAMICSSCHLQGGYSLKSERRFPEGYTPGDNLFAIYRYPWEELENEARGMIEGRTVGNPVDVHQKIHMKLLLDGRNDLKCTSCHDVHAGKTARHTALPRQEFCYQCHTNENGQLGLKEYQVACPICEF